MQPPRTTLFPYTTLFRSRRRCKSIGRDKLENRLILFLSPGHNRCCKLGGRSSTHGNSGVDQPFLCHCHRFVFLESPPSARSEEQRLNSSHVRISYAVFCL